VISAEAVDIVCHVQQELTINNCARMSLMIRRAPSAAWLDEAGQARMNKIDGCIGCNKCTISTASAEIT